MISDRIGFVGSLIGSTKLPGLTVLPAACYCLLPLLSASSLPVHYAAGNQLQDSSQFLGRVTRRQFPPEHGAFSSDFASALTYVSLYLCVCVCACVWAQRVINNVGHTYTHTPRHRMLEDTMTCLLFDSRHRHRPSHSLEMHRIV